MAKQVQQPLMIAVMQIIDSVDVVAASQQFLAEN
jgi:hypothetical protein